MNIMSLPLQSLPVHSKECPLENKVLFELLGSFKLLHFQYSSPVSTSHRTPLSTFGKYNFEHYLYYILVSWNLVLAIIETDVCNLFRSRMQFRDLAPYRRRTQRVTSMSSRPDNHTFIETEVKSDWISPFSTSLTFFGVLRKSSTKLSRKN